MFKHFTFATVLTDIKATCQKGRKEKYGHVCCLRLEVKSEKQTSTEAYIVWGARLAAGLTKNIT